MAGIRQLGWQMPSSSVECGMLPSQRRAMIGDAIDASVGLVLPGTFAAVTS